MSNDYKVSGKAPCRPQLRIQTCNHCLHQINPEDIGRGGIFQACGCEITKRTGSVNRGRYCTHFENRIRESWTEKVNGFMVRSKQTEDYRTRNQWERAGFEPKQGVQGTEMYATRFAAENHSKTYIYYLPEEVEEIGARKC